MSLQKIVDSAQSLEINRTRLVASTVSRNGRLLTASRNWVNPWRITVEPRPVWPWADYRQYFEPVINGDRLTTHTVLLGNTAPWIIDYQGNVARTSNQLNAPVVVQSVTGTTWTITTTGLTGQTLFKAGDILQPVGHYYPYVVTADTVISGNTTTVTTHRGYIPQTSYTIAGAALKVGAGCSWRVRVTGMPTYRMLPSRLAEFTGNFELTEVVE
jgi:hypothetical protein